MDALVAESNRPGRRAFGYAAGAVAIAGLVSLATTTGRPLEPLLLDDGPTFVQFAEHVVRHGALPPIELRPPLYPLVLAAFMTIHPASALHDLVFFQAACWIASAVLVATLIHQLSRRAGWAALGGIAYTTLSHPQFFVRLIYAEAVTVALALAAAVALVAALRDPDGARSGHLWLAAGLAAAAAYSRSVFQVLLPVFGALAFVDALARGRPWGRRVLPFVTVAVLTLAPWYVAHRVVRGAAFFTKGVGYSLTNYLGDRRLLGHFPPAHADLEGVYAARFSAKPTQRYIGWWEVFPEWSKLHEARTGSALSPDLVEADMGRTARAVLLHNPGYAATRWVETWQEFSTHPGWPPRGDFSPIRLAWPFWNVFFTYLGLWLPAAIFAAEALRLAFGPTRDVARMVPIAVFVTVALVNTAIEPWPGQVRYRAAIDAFLIAALVALLAEGVRITRSGGGRASQKQAAPVTKKPMAMRKAAR